MGNRAAGLWVVVIGGWIIRSLCFFGLHDWYGDHPKGQRHCGSCNYREGSGRRRIFR